MKTEGCLNQNGSRLNEPLHKFFRVPNTPTSRPFTGSGDFGVFCAQLTLMIHVNNSSLNPVFVEVTVGC